MRISAQRKSGLLTTAQESLAVLLCRQDPLHTLRFHKGTTNTPPRAFHNAHQYYTRLKITQPAMHHVGPFLRILCGEYE